MATSIRNFAGAVAILGILRVRKEVTGRPGNGPYEPRIISLNRTIVQPARAKMRPEISAANSAAILEIRAQPSATFCMYSAMFTLGHFNADEIATRNALDADGSP